MRFLILIALFYTTLFVHGQNEEKVIVTFTKNDYKQTCRYCGLKVNYTCYTDKSIEAKYAKYSYLTMFESCNDNYNRECDISRTGKHGWEEIFKKTSFYKKTYNLRDLDAEYKSDIQRSKKVEREEREKKERYEGPNAKFKNELMEEEYNKEKDNPKKFAVIHYNNAMNGKYNPIEELDLAILLMPDYVDAYYYRGVLKLKNNTDKSGCNDLLKSVQVMKRNENIEGGYAVIRSAQMALKAASNCGCCSEIYDPIRKIVFSVEEIDEIKKDFFREWGEVKRGLLGVQIQDLNDQLAEKEGLKDVEGVFVVNVNENSAAEAAGILQGDVIIAIDGAKVNTSDELQEKVGKKNPGDKVIVTVMRKGSKMDFTATLKGKVQATK
jgi:hypothetical protein